MSNLNIHVILSITLKEVPRKGHPYCWLLRGMRLSRTRTLELCERSVAWLLAPAGNGGKADNC